jgi:hypothetical protein
MADKGLEEIPEGTSNLQLSWFGGSTTLNEAEQLRM